MWWPRQPVPATLCNHSPWGRHDGLRIDPETSSYPVPPYPPISREVRPGGHMVGGRREGQIGRVASCPRGSLSQELLTLHPSL
jgi:hypothetical protein